MTNRYSQITACLTLVVACSMGTGRRVSGSRFSTVTKEKITGCSSTTCGECLTYEPFFFQKGKYCRWCPDRLWQGTRGATSSDSAGFGVCRGPDHPDHDCTKWILPGVTPFSNNDPAKLDTLGEAGLFCSSQGASNALNTSINLGGAKRRLNRVGAATLASMEPDGPEGLRKVLGQMSQEMQRLNRFSFTNPILFKTMFSQNRSTWWKAGKYGWMFAMYGVNKLVPAAGAGLYLGLRAITKAYNAETKAAGTQGRSQDVLVSTGRATDSQYFTDLDLGMVQDAYMAVATMTSEEVQTMIDDVAESNLEKAGQAGQAVTKLFRKAEMRHAKRIAKAYLMVMAAGATVGSGGLAAFPVWVCFKMTEFTVRGIAELTSKAALAKKTQLTVGLVRLLDESVWEEATDACDITSWNSGVNPCPDKDEDGGAAVPRVCVRSSPWGHHKKEFPKGLFGPDGRCLPTAEQRFSDGLPCLTHDSCGSSYCHFETRMQYFFSDHRRLYRKASDDGVPIVAQLYSMQVREETLPSESAQNHSGVPELAEFVGEYNNTPEGVKYATTGTCATACPKSEIGKGDCAGLTLGDVAQNKDTAVEYDFGIVIRNRIMMGHSQQGYEFVGLGTCAGEHAYSSRGLVVKLHVSETHQLDAASDVQRECAKLCWDTGCLAFNFDYEVDPKTNTSASDKMLCWLYDAVPHTTIAQTRKIENERVISSKCYRQVLVWPLDMYQPWNPAWYSYMSDVKRIVSLLRSQMIIKTKTRVQRTPQQHIEKKAEEAAARAAILQAVQAAYPDFCSATANPVSCPDPMEWTAEEAVNMLTNMAPLSGNQLRILRAKIDPDEKSADKVTLESLFDNADVAWGEAWKRFLGEQSVQEVLNEDKEHRATMKAELVRELQQRATSSNLRTSDGVWDLEAAQEEYLAYLEALNNPSTTTTTTMAGRRWRTIRESLSTTTPGLWNRFMEGDEDESGDDY